MAEHKQGCEALGGYGHGVGPCTCDAAPKAPSGQQAEPTDEQIIACGDAVPGWYDGHDGPSMDQQVKFGRAVLALAGQQSERPAPAGQAVGDYEHAIDTAKACGAIVTQHEIGFTHGEFDRFLAALAGQQSERPAVKEKP